MLLFSILAQPLGWVQVVGKPALCRLNSTGFNPHPTDRLGCSNCRSSAWGSSTVVSILAQPFGWVQRDVGPPVVSILAQPLGWVQCGEHRQISRLFVVSILIQLLGWAQSM